MIKRTEQYQDYLARLFPHNTGLARVVTFQVTDACNLACTYCYQINKGHHVMPFDVAKRFVDLLLDAGPETKYINPGNSQGIVVEFIGGEPFLEIELIDKITDYLITEMIRRQHPWATRYRLSICSNGTLYFKPEVQAYLKKHRQDLSFSISIDGNQRLHDMCRVFPDGRGSYEIAMAGVRDYIAKGGRMGSKMTLCPANIQYTREAVNGLLDSGYREIFLNCVYEEGWQLEDARELYRQLKALADDVIDRGLWGECYISMFEQSFFRPKNPADNQNWCGGDGKMLACDWKGDLYPCIRYMESSLGGQREPLCIGNVYDGLEATQCQQDCVKCLQSITRRSQSTDKCWSCPIGEGCAWCTAYNYQVFGTPDKRATFICDTHKARALANSYFWNKGFRRAGIPKRQKLWIPEEWALEIVSGEEWEMLKNLSGA